MNKPLVYFLCTGNSCRSQMAEGFLRALGGDRYKVESAGIEAQGLNLHAVQAMQEVDIDISHHQSKIINEDILNRAAYVITLCGDAEERCPAIWNPQAVKWHWEFADPAKAAGSEDEIMEQFRWVRDAIRVRIQQFLDTGH